VAALNLSFLEGGLRRSGRLRQKTNSPVKVVPEVGDEVEMQDADAGEDTTAAVDSRYAFRYEKLWYLVHANVCISTNAVVNGPKRIVVCVHCYTNNLRCDREDQCGECARVRTYRSASGSYLHNQGQ